MTTNSIPTRNGILVIPPMARAHLDAHPDVLNLLPEVCTHVELPRDGSRLEVEVDLGRPLGLSMLLPTDPVRLNERTLFSFRKGRKGPSRVAVGRDGPWVSKVLLAAYPRRDGAYALITAYIGTRTPAEPWSRRPGEERDMCLAFWSRHALIYTPRVMSQTFESTWKQELVRHDQQRRGRDSSRFSR